jgi:hypothetical protein
VPADSGALKASVRFTTASTVVVDVRVMPIIDVTMIPRHNANWTPQMTEYRRRINDWIRNKAISTRSSTSTRLSGIRIVPT